MNPIQKVSHLLADRFPEAILELDAADTETGIWYLDVRLEGHAVVVQWNPRSGIGVSTPEAADYGSGPDEVFIDPEAAFARVKTLLISQTKTRSPVELDLPKLRQWRDCSQAQLASRLQVTQASVSRLERRSDVLVGTLKSLIGALGGSLELRARFPDGVVTVLLEQSLPEDAGSS